MLKDVPSSVLIVGSGVFGLSTAYNLAQRPEFKDTKVTVLDRLDFPAHDAASIDSSRIVRPDYPDAAYSKLAAQAQKLWRGDFGAEGRYSESGLAILLDDEDSKLGRAYMEGSLRNVSLKLGLKQGPRSEGGQVTVLDDEEAIKGVVKNMSGHIGKLGYVNWTSGWAHAENAMLHLRRLVEATNRVSFQRGEVAHLLFSPSPSSPTVSGVVLNDASELRANLTILATGAWTPRLLDLRGIASASGQILAYIDLTPSEQEKLGGNPCMLNESSGMFIIPPANNVLKVARHGYGYANPTTIPHPERPGTGETITVSLPRTKTDDPHLNIPAEGDRACRDFLKRCIPELGDRPWTHTRICWYTDTPSSDWLIDYHPTYSGLFVATGGSGHGYKFLPVIGERIAEVLMEETRDELSEELRRKWSWPKEKFRTEHVWTDDWRGGAKGMILDEELKKS
ncbi:uncharacterized protein LTR77_005807 [Saxophila tyrrhenica]|uniref:FAD dependent oxidoreductase domain-containing protein n=1 Tax=Saxophila tyrrhenica TaxID=1690608 RepID=A0AAV9P9I4_9PEZI|nr:hypothetical protein LTR77_005807 [Saxophila tyrrhenica]